MSKSASKWTVRILTAPETNLFLFAFLLHFVYKVWQSHYYEFYGMPSLSDKIDYITYCTLGDGLIALIRGSAVNWLVRSRYWMLNLTRKLTLIFTGLGWSITFVTEIYRVNIAKLYGVPVLAVPGVDISSLALLSVDNSAAFGANPCLTSHAELLS